MLTFLQVFANILTRLHLLGMLLLVLAKKSSYDPEIPFIETQIEMLHHHKQGLTELKMSLLNLSLFWSIFHTSLKGLKAFR